MNNPWLLFCGLFCLYPIIFVGIPCYLIGRYWGRVKLQRPVVIQPMKKLQAGQPRKPDAAGFGGPRP